MKPHVTRYPAHIGPIRARVPDEDRPARRLHEVQAYLKAAGFETWLANAKDLKHLPGGPRPAGWT